MLLMEKLYSRENVFIEQTFPTLLNLELDLIKFDCFIVFFIDKLPETALFSKLSNYTLFWNNSNFTQIK